jgi:hypothetical protein
VRLCGVSLCAAAALARVVNGVVYASGPLTLQDEGAIVTPQFSARSLSLAQPAEGDESSPSTNL